MSAPVPLQRLEQTVDRSRVAGRIEAMLPAGVRPRQLLVRTLLIGMLLTLAGHRPAHLTRVHQALTSLPEADRIRLRVVADWRNGPHLLTYRQVERTFHLVVTALEKEHPDGAPSPSLDATLDALPEASIPPGHNDTTRALAIDWTDLETFSCPPPQRGGGCADPEASRGHRRGDGPGQKDELSCGNYASAAAMASEENGPAVPELARRMTLTSCHLDPARAMVPVLQRLPAGGIALGDIPGDSGYAHRTPPTGPSRCAPPEPASSRTSTPTTAAPRAPTPARSSPTATSTAPPPPGRCSNSAPSPATPPPNRPRPTTRKPPRPPATNSA